MGHWRQIIFRFTEREFPLVLLVGFLLLAVHGLFLWSLQDRLASPARVEAYQRAGFTINKVSQDNLEVIREQRGQEIRRDVSSYFFEPRGYALLLSVVASAMLCAFILQIIANRCGLVYRDRVLLPIALMLSGIGLVILHRLSLDIPHTWPSLRYPSALGWPLKQAAALSVSFLVFPLIVLCCGALEKRHWLQKFMQKVVFKLPLYWILPIVAFLLLVLTSILGGADFSHTLAISVGGFRVQLIELVKPLLVFFMAYFLADMDTAGRLRGGLHWLTMPRASFPILLVTVAITFSAVLFTKDLGLALVCAAFLICAVVIGTGECSVLLLAGSGLAACVTLIIWQQAPLHAFRRFMALANPFAYGEQLARVRWSFAEGGFWGTGIEKGMPFNYANADSDFILAAIAEEMGLIGVVIVIGAIACLVYRGLLIARREEEPFRKHLACSIVTLFAVQTLVIAGGNLGLVPLTGLQLFFVARGGVGCVVNMGLLAVLYQISFVYPVNKKNKVMQPYTGHWNAINQRLRWTALIAVGVVMLLLGRAAWLMLWQSESDKIQPFVDREKTKIVRMMIQDRVFHASGKGIVIDVSRLGSFVSGLTPSEAARIKTRSSTLDGQNLARYSRFMRLEKNGIVLPSWTFSIGNPRLKDGVAYSIVDRHNLPLAVTRDGRRRYPMGAALFPVTGQRRVGAAGFLEKDCRELVNKILEGRYLFLDWSGAIQKIKGVWDGSFWAKETNGASIVQTTISGKLQKKAFGLMRGRPGAIIVMTIPEGEVLALVSSPSFNPDQNINLSRWDAAFADSKTLLTKNRALHVRYPPGSVFKPLIAAAMLEYDPQLNEKDVKCRGIDDRLKIRDAGFRNGRGEKHGKTDLDRALTYSCNIYFANKAEQLGPEPIQQMIHRLGFNENISLIPLVDNASLATEASHVLDCAALAGSDELPAECIDTNPFQPVSSEYLVKHPGLLARSGIGQTVVEVTPMQVAMLYGAIANGGNMVYPQLAKKVFRRAGDNGEKTLYHGEGRQERLFSKQTAATLTTALRHVYQKGTASRRVIPLRLDAKGGKGGPYGLRKKPIQPVAVAAKTGTAQVDGKKAHAWFAAFAPAEKPRVVAVVLVENGGSGGAVAGQIGLIVLRDALRELALDK